MNTIEERLNKADSYFREVTEEAERISKLNPKHPKAKIYLLIMEGKLLSEKSLALHEQDFYKEEVK